MSIIKKLEREIELKNQELKSYDREYDKLKKLIDPDYNDPLNCFVFAFVALIIVFFSSFIGNGNLGSIFGFEDYPIVNTIIRIGSGIALIIFTLILVCVIKASLIIKKDMKKQEEKRSVIFHQLNEKKRMLKLLEDTRDSIIIKKAILNLGTKFTRLQVPEIIERCRFKIKGKYTSDKIEDYERKHDWSFIL